MPKIKIMSIQDLLHIPHLKNSFNLAIIFVTTKPNYYDFGHTTFYQLNIADTKTPIIDRNDVIKLQGLIVMCPYDTIYVCCDAGLSRSPAVAYFIATKLGDRKQALKIDDKYRFMNLALFRKLMVEI